MNRPLLWATACLFSLFAASICFCSGVDQIERGRYLVEEVARCQDCHTPQLPTGEADRSKWMKGATLGFQPIGKVPGWQSSAPDLTSSSFLWKRWNESAEVAFLTTAVGPNGRPAAPPMPAYKLKSTDATAIIAYLKSLR